MISCTVPLRFEFRPAPWGERVEAVCRSWENTPYLEGQCLKGKAADCVHFFSAVMDELYGTDRTSLLRRVRGDTSLHNKEAVVRAMRAILKTYTGQNEVTDGSLEPGDVVVTGPANGGPGHVMVAGGRRGVLWHCTRQTGVQQTGYGILTLEKLFAVYRACDKDTWKC